MSYLQVIDTPIGAVSLIVDEAGALSQIHFGEVLGDRDSVRTAQAERQLQEYFAGERQEFDLPLATVGTPFQRQVWALLRQIPYGETRIYGQLAAELGNPGASRAVGRANATNPLAIVVPCHRVIGSNGTLTGFAGGLNAKQWLLEFERRQGSLF